jgi:hypothetical protein
VPSTRWGHSAAVMDESVLYILGGRNEIDVNDVHCFDTKTQTWS